jgi:hypothetical protein
MAVPAMAQEFDRRAEILGGDREHGRCAVVVVVDGAARIEIRKAEARLIDERGAPAVWRRFECSAEMPRNPSEFGFRMVSGRGRAVLLQPARDGEPAVIRVEDPQSGAGEYRLEIFWRGFGGPPPPPPISRGWVTDDAVRSCQDAVRAKAADQFRTDRIEVRRIGIDEAPGRGEWVVGVLEIRRRDFVDPYRFACSVDFGGRRIRSVDIRPMERH